MKERLMWVLWPAFVVAIPAVGLVFSVLDPENMVIAGIDISRHGAYSIGFLFFWLVGACCSALTGLLQRSPYEVNRCTLPAEGRPPGCPKAHHSGQC